MPCIHCGKNPCECEAQDTFHIIDGYHRYHTEDTEPEQDNFFNTSEEHEESGDFDYTDFNNDWED